MNLTPNFIVQEFMFPTRYRQYGDSSIIFLDQRLVMVTQAIRDHFGVPVTVNNWHSSEYYKVNGVLIKTPPKDVIYTESGLRPFNTPTGASKSDHKYGRAADLKVLGIHPEEVRQFLRNNFSEYSKMGLTAIEKNTPTWVHISVRFTGVDYLVEINF